MTSTPIRIGVDIGGTKTRVGLVESTGRILAEETIPTPPQVQCREHAGQVRHAIGRLLTGQRIELGDVVTIGIGVPGTADPVTGVVEYCPNLDWSDQPLADHLQALLGVRPLVLQDSRCAAWAERLFGVPPVVQSFMSVTVGTGIGSGIVLDNELLLGAMNTAGELGHSLLYRGGRPCRCGNRGCVEQYVSGRAILRRAMETFPDDFGSRPHQTSSVFAMADEGHRAAQTLLGECVDDLAHAVVNAVNLLSVEAVVVSGGLCVYDDQFVTPLRTRVHELGYEPWKRTGRLRLFASRLGPAAPMVGAAFLDSALRPRRPRSAAVTSIPT